MKKITTAALAGLMVVAAGAQASDARWNGFGAANAYIADVQDIFTLPGVVASHADTTYFELGATGATANDWGGVHAALGGGVLGLWFNAPYKAFDNIAAAEITVPTSTTGVVPGTIFGTNPTNQLYAIYGFGLSDATTLGIGISRGVGSSKTETTTSAGTSVSETNLGDLGLNLGVEQKEVGPISLLEVGLQLNMMNVSRVEKSPTTTNKISGGGTAINLRVGGDMAGENGKFSRFELGVNSASSNIKAEPATAPPSTSYVESKNSALKFNLGYAMGGSNDKGMGLFGLMFSNLGQSNDEAYNTAEVDKTSISTTRVLASTAGEASVNSWLTFRAGLESDLFFAFSRTTETGASGAVTKVTTSRELDTVAGNNATKASLGVTAKVGDISFDAVANQNFLFAGPYLISGVATAGGLNTQVSMTWPWGGSK